MILHSVQQCSNLIIIFFVLIVTIASVSGELDARVSLKVDENGFHRNFVYTVDISNFDNANCHVAIYLSLPPALYVNINELADLRRLGINNACSLGEMDVELFTEKAKPQNVTVCAPLAGTQSVLKVPIHQRYQYAQEKGEYVTVVFPRPKLLIGCKNRIKEYRISKINLCSPCASIISKWREIPYTMDEEDYVWLIPIGDSSLLTIITSITLLVTVFGAVFITRTILKTTSKDLPKRD